MRVIKFSFCAALAASFFSLALAARGDTSTNNYSYNFTGPEIYPD